MAYVDFIKSVSGLSVRITPEEGKATVGGATIELVDVDGAVTAMIAADDDGWHRKRIELELGYHGVPVDSFVKIFTGWVTDLKLSKSGTSYQLTATDPQKWLQRKIFRGATESSPVVMQGNPINILLAIITSTGDGDNGDYDWYSATDGLGLDADYINVSAIERMRDTYYPGQSHYMAFSITAPEKAVDFLQREILKVLNCYPTTDGQGRYNVIPFRPPTLTSGQQGQDLTDAVIVGTPTWDANLAAMINEIEFHYDWDGDEFRSIRYEINAASINARGPAKQPLVIKSKGLHTGGVTDVETIIDRRTAAVFDRYAIPPAKIGVKTFLSRCLTEAGDFSLVTHAALPNFDTGGRGISARRMEVVGRTVDWTRGTVSLDLLDVGTASTADGDYVAISPTMTVTAGTSATAFTVSAADAAKFAALTDPVVTVYDDQMRHQARGIVLTDVNATTGAITCSDVGVTPAAGWIITFTGYSSATSEQRDYAYMADAADTLGAAADAAQIISP